MTASLRIRKLPRDTPAEDIAAAAKLIERAFDGSEVSAVWKGDDPELVLARCEGLVTTSTLDLVAYVAEDETGRMIGVMLVKPPGFEHGKSPNVNGPHAKRVEAIAARFPELEAAAKQLKEEVAILKKEAYGPNDVTDTWYISHLAIDPDVQSQGAGGALLRELLGEIGGAKSTLLTLSERLVEYYKRFGYHNLGERAFMAGKTPIRMWAMGTANVGVKAEP